MPILLHTAAQVIRDGIVEKREVRYDSSHFLNFRLIFRDNVCVSKDESADEWTGNEVGLATQPDFTINLQTCSEGKNQYICKTTYV